jgi:poly-gamma-glutamate synthesis protein (capsule biosynthesis protein)
MLQSGEISSHPVVVANRNSAEYSGNVVETTSYVVTVYLRDAQDASILRYPDQTVVYFAGDTLLGRFMDPILRSEEAVRAISNTVRAITRGGPIIANLEGVLLKEPVIGVPIGSHVMNTEAAGSVLHKLGVTAGSLANNHTDDFGALGFRETARNLRHLNIRSLLPGELAEFQTFSVIPLSLAIGAHVGWGPATDPELVCSLRAAPPLIAFVHWGEEYSTSPRQIELNIAKELLNCGVSVVVGAHSHRASSRIELLGGGALQLVYSLGNFVYDQNAARASGALLEVRIFEQGTVATRLIPLPNLYEIGNRVRATTPHLDGTK